MLWSDFQISPSPVRIVESRQPRCASLSVWLHEELVHPGVVVVAANMLAVGKRNEVSDARERTWQKLTRSEELAVEQIHERG